MDINSNNVINAEGNNISIVIGSKEDVGIALSSAFDRWLKQTEIHLTPDLILSSRDDKITQLYHLLNSKPSKIFINSQSEQESYAFVICALQKNSEFTKKTFIVKNQESWDILSESKTALILIPKSFVPEGIGSTIERGHIVIELSEQMNERNGQNVIQLPMIRKSQKITIFETMGFSHDQAWEIFNDTKGYLHAIVKHPLLKPYESTKPLWLDKYAINILSTILFINSWNRTNDFDRKVIESLVDEKYEKFEEILYQLKSEKETPIRLIGNVWQVVSKIYLWEIINQKIPIEQTNKLESIVFDVFTEIDPLFFVSAQDRWSAYDKKMKYSETLRDSLSDTLILISLFWSDNYDYKRWIKKVFDTNLNVEAWYSYQGQLKYLAEACPECFLDALDRTIDNISITHIEQLFEDGGHMGGCFHCNLLWALEAISWNKEHVVKVVLALAKLTTIPITSKMANQPVNTLNNIFLGWINYTSLTHQEKIQIIEHHLCKKHPQIAWKLLLKLLPSMHSMSSGIAKPKYHDWDESLPKEVYQNDYAFYISEINRLILTYMTDETSPWLEIFDHIDKLEIENTKKIIDKFIFLDKTKFDAMIQLQLANKLRDEIHQHRKYSYTDWAMPKELVDQLEKAFQFIEPERLIYKIKFLFDQWHPHILTPSIDDERHDWEKEARIAESLREEAVQKIIETEEFSEFITLITTVENPGLIGRALGAINFQDSNVILEWLARDDRHLVICAKSYFEYSLRSGNLHIDELDMSQLNTQQIGEILLALSFESATFEILQKQNDEVQNFYWRNVSYYFLDERDYSWINWILEQFYKFKYPMKAIDFFAHFLYGSKTEMINVNTKILYDVLVQFVTNENEEQLNHHDTLKVIEFLQHNHNDNNQLQQIEWIYVALNGLHPKFLEKEIISNPSFFVELVSWVWKPKNSIREDEGLTQEQLKTRATTAYNLIDKVTLVPGQDQKIIDVNILRNWISDAQKLFIEADRIDIGNDQIGKILSIAPVGSDGIWPHEAIREILEEFTDEHISTAFIVGKSNKRGITTRAYDEGGNQEYVIADRYKLNAKALELLFPTTSKILHEMSEDYVRRGKWEDERNEI
ncbi:MAG: hypothetical protein Q7T91_11270 [Sulfuricurvum sp.]|nr:hypothetical protein [Sulfuricurvum sp.]